MINPESQAELAPCPFCGRKPEESERADNVTSTGKACFIACMCGGYSANAHQFGETREEVVRKWNRRAAQTPVVAPSDMHPKQESAYKSLVAALRSQLTEVQKESAKNAEAVNTLASERAANEQLTAELEAARAAPPSTPVVPEGWKLVPMEPDDAQQAAGAAAIRIETTVLNKLFTANRAYRDMLAAAPPPPKEAA
jgi:Lar family restriction alleviation protein